MEQNKTLRLKLGIIGAFLFLGVVALFTTPKSPLNIAGLVDVGGGLTEPSAEYFWAVDHYAGSTDVQWYADRKDDGVGLVFQTLWTGISSPWSACTSIQAARDAGLATVGYISLSNAYYGRYNVDYGYEVCPQFWQDFLFVAIDIELYLFNPIDQIQQAIDRVRELGQLPVIYTSWGTWNQYAAGSYDFANIPLWNALWDYDPDVDFPRWPFGGFQVVVCEQYQNDYDWGGVRVDLNVCDKRLLQQPAPLPQPDPTPTPEPVCDPTTWLPWDNYGKDVGFWYSGDFNKDNAVDLLHVVSEEYVHPWLGKVNDRCTYDVDYAPRFYWSK